jgi:predicted transposase YbfD/YdcC
VRSRWTAKTVRGARTHSGTGEPDGPARHLLAVIDHDARVVLGQVEVDGKTSEIHHFAPLLDGLELREVVVTADALHTRRAHVDYLAARGAHWVLTVKGNQPSLRRQLAGMPWRAVEVGHRSAERGHGRREIRTLKVITIAAGIMFPHAAQAIRLTRRRRSLSSGKWHTETVYAITDLRPHQASPQQLAGWIRGHWQIENSLHWVRDVTYAEDDSQVRTGHAPQVMASLRNFAISAHRLAGASNIAAALRHCSRNSARALAVLKIIR